jgi:hypothetical protein
LPRAIATNVGAGANIKGKGDKQKGKKEEKGKGKEDKKKGKKNKQGGKEDTQKEKGKGKAQQSNLGDEGEREEEEDRAYFRVTSRFFDNVVRCVEAGDNDVTKVTIVEGTLNDTYHVHVHIESSNMPQKSPALELDQEPRRSNADPPHTPPGLPIALLREFAVHQKQLTVSVDKAGPIEAGCMFAYDEAHGVLSLHDGNHRINTSPKRCADVDGDTFTLNQSRVEGGTKIVEDEDDRVLTSALLDILGRFGMRREACFSPQIALLCHSQIQGALATSVDCTTAVPCHRTHDTCNRTGRPVGAVTDVPDIVRAFVKRTLHGEMLYTHPDGHCLRRSIGKIYGIHPGEVIQHMREKCSDMINNAQFLSMESDEEWYKMVRDRPEQWNNIKNNVEAHCLNNEWGGDNEVQLWSELSGDVIIVINVEHETATVYTPQVWETGILLEMPQAENIEKLRKLHLRHATAGSRKPQYLLYGQNHYNSISYLPGTTLHANKGTAREAEDDSQANQNKRNRDGSDQDSTDSDGNASHNSSNSDKNNRNSSNSSISSAGKSAIQNALHIHGIAAAAAAALATRTEMLVEAAVFLDQLPQSTNTPSLWCDIFDRRAGKNVNTSDDVCQNDALADIKERIESYGQIDYDSFGLPEVINAKTELQREQHTAHDALEYRAFLADNIMNLAGAESTEQLEAYRHITGDTTDITIHYKNHLASDEILSPFNAPKFDPCYVDGMSGRGKTFLMKLVTAYYRMHKKIVLCCATTGIASMNHEINGSPYGYTAHSRFGLPVDENEDVTRNKRMVSTLPAESQRMELLHHADLIIWDELAMANRHQLNCADDTLRNCGYLDPELPFGGMRFVGCGDFHQIPPVIPNAPSEKVILATVLHADCWPMHVMTLYAPKRDSGALQHSSFVDKVGEGLCTHVAISCKPELKNLIEIANVRCTTDLETALQHAYGDQFQHMNDDKRAVVTTHNTSVEELNSIMLSKLHAPLKTMYSEDRMEEEEQYSRTSFSHVDFFNKLTVNPASIPPHALEIKVGAMAMLMRNLSKKDKLMNGTRIVIQDIHKYSIIVRTCCDGKLHALSRILFRIQCKRSNTSVLRRQFPIRLAYAMTVHKCQGQTLDRVVLDMRQQPFSHGILYVACGRVRNAESLIALVDSAVMTTGEQADLRALVTNLVWPELLPAAWRGTNESCLPPVPQPPQPARTQDEANEAHADSGSDGDSYYYET